MWYSNLDDDGNRGPGAAGLVYRQVELARSVGDDVARLQQWNDRLTTDQTWRGQQYTAAAAADEAGCWHWRPRHIAV